MLSAQSGNAASPELASWAKTIVQHTDPAVEVEVWFEDDSHTYILRLVKGSRVLIFRLSPSQVHTDGREAECERTLLRKIRDLWNLI